MILRLQPAQIAEYWEHIKYAACMVGRVPEAKRPEYCKKLLYELMSGKGQIWFGLNSEKVIKVIGYTKVTVDESTGQRELFVYWIYGYHPMTDEDAIDFFNGAKLFAKNAKCEKIRAFSNVERVWHLCEINDGKQPYRVYEFIL